jgi:hypothetical protein
VNNAAFWIYVQKPKATSASECYLKPLNPRKVLIFSCKSNYYYFFIEAKEVYTPRVLAIMLNVHNHITHQITILIDYR